VLLFSTCQFEKLDPLAGQPETQTRRKQGTARAAVTLVSESKKKNRKARYYATAVRFVISRTTVIKRTAVSVGMLSFEEIEREREDNSVFACGFPSPSLFKTVNATTVAYNTDVFECTELC
jgi:hypothetical protein